MNTFDKGEYILMKKRNLFFPTLILSLVLTGCAPNNGNNEFAHRDQNGADLARVNYTPKQGGPAMTTSDISDPGLDVEQNRIVNHGATNVNNTGTTRARIQVADYAAQKITAMPQVDRATIIVADNNAYVAVKLKDSNQNGLSEELEHKIFRKVKSSDDQIDNVYISTNQAFYKRMNTYVRDRRNGNRNDNFQQDFSNTIRRVFPDAK
jgi:spore cortex protein